MSADLPEISLILNTYNQPGALEKALTGLAEQSRLPSEVVVADDGSGPETAAVIRQWSDRGLFPIQHVWQEHGGFRRSRILNRAIAASRGNYLVFLDGDCIPHRRFVEDHAALAEAGCWVQGRRCYVDITAVDGFSPHFGSVVRCILTGKLSGAAKAFRLPFVKIKRNQSREGILGCNLAIWREDLVAVNGYDESFEGWGREDSDLGFRLYHLGRWRKLVHGRAILYHLNHPVVSRDQLSTNEDRLQETIRLKKIRCEKGLEAHG